MFSTKFFDSKNRVELPELVGVAVKVKLLSSVLFALNKRTVSLMISVVLVTLPVVRFVPFTLIVMVAVVPEAVPVISPISILVF